jgi:hypothetical protein
MNYWILQSNPNTYRQNDYMRAHWDKPDTWSISRYTDEIDKEDIAYIWLSNEKGKKTRGIYAMAEITELPILGKKFEWEGPYWIDKREKQRLLNLPKIELRYVKLIVDKPLLVEELRTSSLRNLPILHMPQRSIYKLTEEDGYKISSIIQLR